MTEIQKLKTTVENQGQIINALLEKLGFMDLNLQHSEIQVEKVEESKLPESKIKSKKRSANELSNIENSSFEPLFEKRSLMKEHNNIEVSKTEFELLNFLRKNFNN